MVATLVNGLGSDPDLELLHVNVRLSRDSADIGGWRAGKLLPLLAACFRAWRIAATRRGCAFYYVPAPGKRSALYRDLLVMLLCRPFFSRLILHWHAVGLGEWLQTRAWAMERVLAGWLLGRAALAIVLAPELSDDAKWLNPKRTAVVANAIPDPATARRTPRAAAARHEALFLGMCSREKGIFAALEAVAHANQSVPGGFHLTVAGGFASAAEEREFLERSAALPSGSVTYAGFADERKKQELFESADVFCFPTTYAHEGQPLALIEALAHDVPIITTRWRAIPGMLPSRQVWFVDAAKPETIAAALLESRQSRSADSVLRQHYLTHFTPERHLAAMKAALLSTKS